MDFGSILLAALGIGLLIFLHELGHFLAARLAGVRVEVFSLGFGTRLCGFVWRGTDFRLSVVPFGGYVMVAGQDPGDRRYPARESLWSKSVGQRALFWSGGVVMNVLFALVAFPLVFHAGVVFPAPIVGQVVPGGAAWEAGLAPGDRVLAVDGKKVHSFDNLRMEVALAGGRPVVLSLLRADGSEQTRTLLPQFSSDQGLYELGVLVAADPKPPTLAVTPGGVAARAGLRDGDELLAVAGREASGDDAEALTPLLLPGPEPLTVAVRRDGRQVTAELRPAPAETGGPPRIGVSPLPRVVRGLRQGVPSLERLDLRRGDLLLAVDARPFLGELEAARTGPDELVVHVRRDGRETVLRTTMTADERQAFVDAVALRADDGLMLAPAPELPAAAAGLRAGDRVVAVDGRAVDDFEDLRRAVESAGERPLQLRVQRWRAGTDAFLDPATGDLPLADVVDLTIAPRHQPAWDVGLVPQLVERGELVRAGSFGEALRLGTALSLDLVKQLYVTMKRMLTGEVGAKNLGGIIRISQVSYRAAQRGPSWFAYLLAMLSLNLAFVNLLPIPVLDGGHLMFLLIEKVKGSPVSTRVFGYSQVVGLVFVLMLVLFVTYNDILQLL